MYGASKKYADEVKIEVTYNNNAVIKETKEILIFLFCNTIT